MSFKLAFISPYRRRIDDPVFALQAFTVVRFMAFFLVSVLLAKIPLELDQIASYEYVLFLSSIVTGWWIHGFIQSFMAATGDNYKKKGHYSSATFRDYSRMLILLGGSVLILSVGGIKLLSTRGILETPPEGFYFFLMFHFFLQAGVLMVYYFHQKRWTRCIYLSAVYFFLIYLGSFLLLTGDNYLLADVYRWLTGFSVPVMAAWIFLYFDSKTSEPKASIKKRSYPHLHVLVLIQAIGFISLWSDGFWVQYFYGTGDLFALFRYGGREFPLFIILTTTFATAMIHQANQKNGASRIKQGSVRFVKLFFPVVVVLIVSSQWLFGWVYRDEFMPASTIFDAYLLLTFVRVVFPRPLLIAAGKYNALLWVSVGELVINLVLSLALYQVWGILGLILATLIAHFFELGASIYIVSQNLKINIESYLPVRLYVIFIFATTLILVIKYVWFTQGWIETLL